MKTAIVTAGGYSFEVLDQPLEARGPRDCFSLSFHDVGCFVDINTVLDIGAHVGGFSYKVAKIFGARVHAYEVYGPNAEICKRNLAPIPGVEVFHSAVLGAGAVATGLNTPSGAAILTSVTEGRRGQPSKVPYIGITEAIDKLAGKTGVVDLVKMNCEGSEKGIIKSLMKGSTPNRVRNIVMEWHSPGPQDWQNLCQLSAGRYVMESEVASDNRNNYYIRLLNMEEFCCRL